MVTVSVAALALVACGLGDKQAHADRLHGSVDLLPEVVAVSMTIDVTMGDDPFAAVIGDAGAGAGETPHLDGADLPEGMEPPDGMPGESPAAPTGMAVVGTYRPETRSAALTLGDDPKVSSIFVGDEIYARRQNARPTERRQWGRVDIADDDVDLSRPLGLEDMPADRLARAIATSVNPTLLIDLIIGALTGSIGVVADPSAPEGTTTYEFNVSLDKALTDLDLDDDTRAVREGMFRLFGLTDDVIGGRAVLGPDGRLRHLELNLESQASRTTSHDVAVMIDLADGDPTVFPAAPAADRVVTYASVGRLVSSAMRDV